MLQQFPGQVYGTVRQQAATTFAIVLLVLVSVMIIGWTVRFIDKAL